MLTNTNKWTEILMDPKCLHSNMLPENIYTQNVC